VSGINFADRKPRKHAQDDCRVIWVDAEVAKKHDINLDRMKAVYEPIGLKIVSGFAPEIDGFVICPGCEVSMQRTRENWRPCKMTIGGWRGVCRVCENSEMSNDERAVNDRQKQYAKDPGLLTRGEEYEPSTSWNDSNSGILRVGPPIKQGRWK
jgi:hypothetical protein